MKRPKPLVIERDGVRVAVAVQVQVSPAAGGCGCDDTPRRLPAPPSALADAAVSFAWGLKLGASWALLMAVRGIGLAFNVAGLLGAKLARAYLLGWAELGGTHKQLSRQLSPWLPAGRTPNELPALVAEVLQRPESVEPYRPPLPPHVKTTWAQLAAAPDNQPATATRRLKP